MNSMVELLASSSFIMIALQIIILVIQIAKMEMKINFDHLFGSPQELNSTFETPSLELDHSYQNSLNQSFQYKFTFNQTLFDRQAEDIDHIKLMEDSQQEEEIRSVQTKKSTKTKQSAISVRPSQPGQRLFYESQESEMRKNKERERIQKEKIAELKSMPFAPTINKKSRKLAQKIKTEPKEQIKGRTQAKTTTQLKEQQIMKECTFQPKLIAKNAKGQSKSKQQLFYYLHNTSKIKQLKLSRKAQQEFANSKMKKVSKQVFIQFLKRNEEYNNVTKKKHELMKQKADNYDLKTGQKLFSPKISDHKYEHFIQNSSSSKNILISTNNAQHNYKFQTNKKNAEPQPQKPKLKSSLFAKRNRADNQQPIQIKHIRQDSQKKSVKALKPSPRQEQYYSEQYRQYSQQFDRRTAEIRDSSLSQHEAIPEQSEHSVEQPHPQKQDSPNQEQNEVNGYRTENQKFLDEEAVELQAQIWNSHEIRPFELSNVNQYLNASEQDQHEPRNNYVMDILNNLMGSKPEEE